MTAQPTTQTQIKAQAQAQAPQQPLITLNNICRFYQSGETVVKALNDVSLSIWPGEFIAIMGQSGSGKSTMMNIIGCLDRPTDPPPIIESGIRVNLVSRNGHQVMEEMYGKEALHGGADYWLFASGRGDDWSGAYRG